MSESLLDLMSIRASVAKFSMIHVDPSLQAVFCLASLQNGCVVFLDDGLVMIIFVKLLLNLMFENCITIIHKWVHQIFLDKIYPLLMATLTVWNSNYPLPVDNMAVCVSYMVVF